MDDLISRQAAIDALEEAKKTYFDRSAIIGKMQDTINHLPAAQPEQKAGNWLADFDGYADGEPVYDMWWCSACGEYFNEWDEQPTWKYCPNCGAKMENPRDNGGK